jgi:hypothetical protein
MSATDFFPQVARIFNSDQARCVTLCGNVYDLFDNGTQYVPLIPLLCEKSQARGVIRVVYELNGPVRILDAREEVKRAWIAWRAGQDYDTLLIKQALKARGPSEAERRAAEFEQILLETAGNPTLALEFLRQLTICSRSATLAGDLLIVVEAADMLLPAGGEISTLSDKQLHRISIMQDWLGDPGFLAGRDSLCLVAESRSLVHPRISRLPQVLPVEILPPDTAARLHFIQHFSAQGGTPPKLWSTPEELAANTAGLSIHAVRQLLAGASHTDQAITPADVIAKVEEYIQGQLGEDVVEFKKPAHTLDDVIGFAKLKQFLREELIPRFRAPPEKALTGAAVAGAIGGGKTFIFEAVAGELGLPVLVLKNIRSQWYGQTDVIFERLRRMLEALDKVLIFVDEADTQFGGVGQEEHSTERRLTGKIQAMMSDPRLRGRVVWLLMTARIHLLSPDIRRPGRVGDLIIPVLDPEGEDRREFLRWVVKAAIAEPTEAMLDRLDGLTRGYSAAAFASLRQQLKAVEPETFDEVVAVVQDLIPPAIDVTRRYQTLQALVNCTRRSLLPDPNITEKDRQAWQLELRQLEAMGAR